MSGRSETTPSRSAWPSLRPMPPPTSGGVKLSFTTDRRSDPPPFWAPRQGPIPTEKTQTHPDGGPAKQRRVDSVSSYHSGTLPSEPSSPWENSIDTPPSSARSDTLKGLWAHAPEFKPRQPPVVGLQQDRVEVDLNTYMKQSMATAVSPSGESPSPSPSRTGSPTEFEEVERQWLDQAQSQWGSSDTDVEDTGTQNQDKDVAVPLTSHVSQHHRPAGAVAISTVSAFALALAEARMIEDFASVKYPERVKPPESNLRVGREKRNICYDRDFLLQFKDVCSGRPGSFPSVSNMWLQILPPFTNADAPGKGAVFHSRRTTEEPVNDLHYSSEHAGRGNKASSGRDAQLATLAAEIANLHLAMAELRANSSQRAGN